MSQAINLSFQTLGTGPNLIILHGLFGSARNWLKVAGELSKKFKVWLVDLRNHGQSPHVPTMNLDLLVADLEKLISDNQITSPILLGHSLGGSTAMQFAIKNPRTLKALIVVDIAPKKYKLQKHHMLAQMLQELDLSHLKNLGQAKEILAKQNPDKQTNSFLLTNLKRDKNNWYWQVNLDAIIWWTKNEQFTFEKNTFLAPTLFIYGQSSDYVSKADEPMILNFFPNAQLQCIKSAGHWVQFDAYDKFIDQLNKFLVTI